ncbi:hypothetical protein [Streptomyces sp. NPDC058683]
MSRRNSSSRVVPTAESALASARYIERADVTAELAEAAPCRTGTPPVLAG